MCINTIIISIIVCKYAMFIDRLKSKALSALPRVSCRTGIILKFLYIQNELLDVPFTRTSQNRLNSYHCESCDVPTECIGDGGFRCSFEYCTRRLRGFIFVSP